MEQKEPRRPMRRRPAKSQEEIAKFWREFEESYARLKADPEAWAAEEAERTLWDCTVGDGLSPEV